MTTEALKSAVITNLDAVPVVRPTTGEGGVGHVRQIDGYVTATTGTTSGSTYRLVRVPSNAKIKHLRACIDASVTTFTCDMGVYYATDALTSAALAGTVVDADFFASAVDLHAIITLTEYSFESTTYVASKRQQPLWQAVGLTSDPGGFLDIVLTNTATNSGAPVVYAEVEYVM